MNRVTRLGRPARPGRGPEWSSRRPARSVRGPERPLVGPARLGRRPQQPLNRLVWLGRGSPQRPSRSARRGRGLGWLSSRWAWLGCVPLVCRSRPARRDRGLIRRPPTRARRPGAIRCRAEPRRSCRAARRGGARVGAPRVKPIDSLAPPPRPDPTRRRPPPTGAAFCHTHALRCADAALRLSLPRLRRHVRGQPPDARGLGTDRLPAGALRHRQAVVHNRAHGPGWRAAVRAGGRRRWLLRRGLRLRLRLLSATDSGPAATNLDSSRPAFVRG